MFNLLTQESRGILARAAKSGNGWFKNISAMETVAVEIVGPNLATAGPDFRARIAAIFRWTANEQE